MSTQISGQSRSIATVYDRNKLFVISVISLVTTGMVASIRASILNDLQKTFFDPIDPIHAAQMVAAVAGVAFAGFAFSIIIASPLCDYLGMRNLLGLACLLTLAGTLTTLFAAQLKGVASIYWVLWFGVLTVGLANGLVEAVINPLAATLYPEDKTHRLNVLHAWWPGGLIIGGLIGYFFGQGGHTWQMKLATILIPAIAYGVMLFGTKFPPTERVAARVSAGEMLREMFKPLFIIWFCCMFLTASSELAPGQWVDLALTRTVHFQGILLLVYISGLMFVMRHFAGPIAHKLSPVGLLWFSALFASIGLYLLSIANSPITGLLAATVWGVGVCYMWPTMLGVTSERFPKGGALLLGIMGSAGNIAIYFVLPKIGEVYDNAKVAAAHALGTNYTALETAAKVKTNTVAQGQLNEVLTKAATASFQFVAILPAILLIVFGAIWLYDKSRGGYKAVQLETIFDEEPESTPL